MRLSCLGGCIYFFLLFLSYFIVIYLFFIYRLLFSSGVFEFGALSYYGPVWSFGLKNRTFNMRPGHHICSFNLWLNF